MFSPGIFAPGGFSMTAVSRTAQFTKIHKILKKHYKPSSANPGRSVTEHLIFACCLEDARHEAAEEAFAALVHTFFDWNEVRVTSISELSEIMACLPDPRLAANRIKRVLHAIFEAQFNFDMEDKRKKNLGPTVKWLEGLDGASRFSAAYVVQAALGGHSIPIDIGTMNVLRLLDLVTDKDVEAGEVPGLERAIAKSKGPEFASLLHQFGADFSANPYSPAVKGILLEIDPSVQSRLPKRRAEPQIRKKAAEPPVLNEKPTTSKQTHSGDKTTGRKKAPPPQVTTPEPASKKAKKKPHSTPEKPVEQTAEKISPRDNPLPKKKSVSEGLSKRKPR
jgi:endonuclease III